MRIRICGAFICARVCLAPSGVALAAEDTMRSPRVDKPRFVRAEAQFSSDLFGGNDFGTTGVSVGWDFSPFFGLETHFGLGRENQDQDSPGPAVMANVRLLPLVSASQHHALVLAAGGMRFWNGAWGDLNFAHLEIGYDLRLPIGLTAAAGLGMDVALTASREPERKQGCALVCFGEPTQVDGGDVYPRFRLGLGWSF